MIKKILIFVFIANTSLSACCGCALVAVSMNLVTIAVKSGVKLGDEAQSLIYDRTILENNKKTLAEMQKRLKELSNTFKVNSIGAGCDNEVLFELNKTNSMQSVIKSMQFQ